MQCSSILTNCGRNKLKFQDFLDSLMVNEYGPGSKILNKLEIFGIFRRFKQECKKIRPDFKQYTAKKSNLWYAQ